MRFASIAIGAAACVSTASGSVVSTFDTDADGWGITGDANGFTWSATGGSTGETDDGYVFANDAGQGIIWNFDAPVKFLGDQSEFAGGMLSWDLIQISTPGSDIDDQPDVILKGAGLVLVVEAGASPAGTWTSYDVALSEAGGWRI
ncbi:MAG: laminin B domain-containing protein, partial [Planctomycetota bacterium]